MQPFPFSFLDLFLQRLPSAVPYLLMYAACFICCLCLRDRAPKAALLAAIGSAILFVWFLLDVCVSSYLIPLQLQERRTGIQVGSFLFGGWGIIRIMGNVVGFVLVFAAVFVGRSPQGNRKSVPPPLPPS